MKRQFLLTSATAVALMLGGCSELFGSDEVTVTVTDTANVRDAPTADGSNVIAKLEAGTDLSGEWVATSSAPQDRWLQFDFNGKKAFVWAGNLLTSHENLGEAKAGISAQARGTSERGSGATKCSGSFAYIPSNRDAEVPFSIEVQPTAVRIVWMDYSPEIFAQKHANSDGSIVFYAENGGASYLRCNGNRATLKLSDQLQTNRTAYNMVRSDGDIFTVAKKRGWSVGD